MTNKDAKASLVQPKVCPDPIFIVGAPRSGTTILAQSLAKHSQLWASTESGFLLDLFGGEVVEQAFKRSNQRKRWVRKEGVTRDEFFASLGLGPNALFTSRSQGKRWIDHTNRYTLMVDTLADMFPGAFFLHALRDGRRAVHSTLHLANRFEGNDRSYRPKWFTRGRLAAWAGDFRQACQVWSEHVELAMDFAQRHPQRCLTIRHEQMIAEPERLFAEIFEFVSAPYEDAPAEFYRSNRINSSFPELYKQPNTAQIAFDPWPEWDLQQKTTFVAEAGRTMVQHSLITRSELDQLAAEAQAGG